MANAMEGQTPRSDGQVTGVLSSLQLPAVSPPSPDLTGQVTKVLSSLQLPAVSPPSPDLLTGQVTEVLSPLQLDGTPHAARSSDNPEAEVVVVSYNHKHVSTSWYNYKISYKMSEEYVHMS